MAVVPKARQVIKAGFGAGRGLRYFFKPRRALNTGVRLTKGNFSEVTFRTVAVSAVDLNATTSGVNIGLAWFAMKPQ